jgi:hypothetical protein
MHINIGILDQLEVAEVVVEEEECQISTMFQR